MEKLMEAAGGNLSGILAAIAVTLCLHLLAKIGEFLWKLREKRDSLTESGIEKLSSAVQLNTNASEKLEHRIKALEHTFTDLGKAKLDMRRLYAAVKQLAGDKWPEIRRHIMEEVAE